MRELDGSSSTRANEELAKSVEEVGENAEKADREFRNLAKALGQTVDEAEAFEKALSDELSTAFTDVMFESESLKDALKGLGEQMSQVAYTTAVESVADSAAGVITGGLDTFLGSVFQAGSTAKGAFSGGSGGSAGGVSNWFSERGGATPGQMLPVSVVMNVTSPDAPSFQRSQNQIAAGLSRAINRAGRVR